MFRRDPRRRGASRASDGPRSGHRRGDVAGAERFILYVEGARDREVLQGWARHVAPIFGPTLERSTVILGGRQPARAIEDFRRRGGAEAGLAGLVVLDRDDHRDFQGDAVGADRVLVPGLERFIWSLRHIESYLLVPAAIRRVVPNAPDEATLMGWLAEETGASSGAGRLAAAHSGGPHAKRLLGAGGALSASLGVELRAGEIARAMRRDELHADVHALFARIAALRGVAETPPEVVIRAFTRESASED